MFRLHKPRWFHRALLLLLALGFLLSLGDTSTPASADPGSPVRLSGHVLTRLAAMRQVGALPPTQTLTLTIALRPAAPNALHQAAMAANRPGMARLAPIQVAQLYGRPRADLAALDAYFTSFGFSPAPPAADGLSFQVSGTVAQAERALDVSLGTYVDAQGHRFYATNTDPALPASLAPMVQAILGLDNYPALHPLHSQIPSNRGTAGEALPASPAAAPVPGEYTPANIVTAYNLQSLYSAGRDGAGQTVGIVGCDAFTPSDISTFDAQFGLPSRSVAVVDVDGGATGTDPETTLDLEWSGALATGAALRFYGFPASDNGGCPFSGFVDAVSQAVGDNTASVVSISLGTCEDFYSSANILGSLENEFSAASLEGQSVLVASGDSGAFCDSSNGTLEPSYPASSAFVTAVGGTTLYLNSDSTYEGEAAWGSLTECDGPCGSGGGISHYIAEPCWQNSDGINSGGKRQVPDVALDADPATGYWVFDSAAGGWLYDVGGTSVAAPEWAGLTAIANQQASKRLGLLGPILYSTPVLQARSSATPPYHDVTTGNNLYYNATTGWDYTTGWGSLDAANLVSAMASTSFFDGAGSAPASVSSTTSALPYRVFLPVVINAGCAAG